MTDPRGPDTKGHCGMCGRYLPDELRPAPGGAPVCATCAAVAHQVVKAHHEGRTFELRRAMLEAAEGLTAAPE